LRLFSFGGYGLALAALVLVVFVAIECPPFLLVSEHTFFFPAARIFFLQWDKKFLLKNILSHEQKLSRHQKS